MLLCLVPRFSRHREKPVPLARSALVAAAARSRGHQPPRGPFTAECRSPISIQWAARHRTWPAHYGRITRRDVGSPGVAGRSETAWAARGGRLEDFAGGFISAHPDRAVVWKTTEAADCVCYVSPAAAVGMVVRVPGDPS